MFRALFRLFLSAGFILQGFGSAWADDAVAQSGRELAQQYCSACHRVTQEQAIPPDVAVGTGTATEEYRAPSFRQIAARPDRTEAQIRERILNPHYPMREQQFVPEELDAIVAYILALRTVGADSDW